MKTEVENWKKQRLAIIVKYLGATDRRASRIKLSFPREGMYKSKTLEYDHAYGGTLEQAQSYLEEAGVEHDSFCYLGDKHLIVIPFGQHETLEKVFGKATA